MTQSGWGLCALWELAACGEQSAVHGATPVVVRNTAWPENLMHRPPIKLVDSSSIISRFHGTGPGCALAREGGSEA